MTKYSIRVVMPFHLQTLAQVGHEVPIELEGQVTLSSLLDSIEAKYPMLSGTIRDHVTKQRRPLLRFFVCEQDISHVPSDTTLPAAVLTGAEPFIIWGAVAGG